MYDTFREQGFLVLEKWIAPTLCDMLMERAAYLIDQFEPTSLKTIFSTRDQQHAKQRYFLESGDKIRFFYEAKALNEAGELLCDKSLAINKIGHALHDVDPVFNCFSRQHRFALLMQALEMHDPLLLQSMYICKPPFIGGEVTCHQDSTYLYTKEQPVIGLWFALQDATIQNGCLWAIPGGHRTGLKSRMIRQEETTSMMTFDDRPWDLQQMIPLEVSKGSCIVLHGHLPHMSYENQSADARHAYSLHLISGREPYPHDNWLQRGKDTPLRGF